jgi:hypothetical protein
MHAAPSMQSAQRVGPEDKRRVALPFLSEQRDNVRAQVHAHRRKPLACLPTACWAPQLAPASSLDHRAEPIRHARLAPERATCGSTACTRERSSVSRTTTSTRTQRHISRARASTITSFSAVARATQHMHVRSRHRSRQIECAVKEAAVCCCQRHDVDAFRTMIWARGVHGMPHSLTQCVHTTE